MVVRKSNDRKSMQVHTSFHETLKEIRKMAMLNGEEESLIHLTKKLVDTGAMKDFEKKITKKEKDLLIKLDRRSQ